MWPAASFVTLVANCLLVWPATALNNTTDDDRKVILIGYLPTIKGMTQNRQGLIISGALSFAVSQVNNDTNLLPNHVLKFTYTDTEGSTLQSANVLTNQWKNGSVAFFGPEDTCEVEATVASGWNLPMISHKCADHDVSNKDKYPTFARTFPPDTQIVKSIIALLKKYLWEKFSIVHDDSSKWRNVADKLVESSAIYKLKVLHKEAYLDPSVCCEKNHPCCKMDKLHEIIDKTHQSCRIYVFLGEMAELVSFMEFLDMKKLLNTGEYMVIYASIDPIPNKQYHALVWPTQSEFDYNKIVAHNLERCRYLLIVVTTPTDETSNGQFESEVGRYNTQPPFDFSDPLPRNKSKVISIYAAHLYDAVMIYAKALNQVLAQGGNETEGQRIIKTIIDTAKYTSIRGYDIIIDKNGDSEGNFSVLTVFEETDPKKYYVYKEHNFSKFITKVGTFQGTGQGNLPLFYLDNDKSISWKNGNPPPDTPPCGFDGKKCHQSYDIRNIVSYTLGSLLFTVIISAIILYKNWKYEQEISGLLWKINLNDVKLTDDMGHHDYNIHISASKSSLQSHLSSLESRSLYPVYAPTATYKGVMVVMKRWRFPKRTEITRNTMKEMRAMRTIHHHNVNTFHGASIQTSDIYIFTEYCARGSLPDILENDDLKLDTMFIASLIFDLIKGMIYLHDSELKIHGNLKSSNCVVTSRWVLQVSDFGLHEFRRQALKDYDGEDQHYFSLLWTAPEFLRSPETQGKGTQQGDVYAFGIILHEIIERNGPYGDIKMSSKEIIEKVKWPLNGDTYFRPNTYGLECQDFIVKCMEQCWQEKPEERPSFAGIRRDLKNIRSGRKNNIFDHMMSMMEKYANNLEELVEERTLELVEEKKKTEALLHRMLPQSVALQLMKKLPVAPESFEAVTIYFSDIVGFTEMSAQSTPLEVVNFLNDLYTAFDAIIRNYDVYKVETIGDAYMVVSGLPIRNGDLHAGEIASMALELLNSIRNFKVRHRPDQTLKLRIGIHTGPVVAGVVGITMPRYCLFGDTVNTASRMESTGEALKIHISRQCRDHLEKLGGYIIAERGAMKIKGKGEMVTSWLLGQTAETAQQRRRPNTRDMTPPMPLFNRKPDGDLRRRSPKMGLESRSLSLLGRRNSSIPRMCETDSNGPMGPPAFLNLNQESSSASDSPCRRRRSPGRGRSYSIDKDATNSVIIPSQSYDGDLQTDSSISPERKRDSREVMFEGVSDEGSSNSQDGNVNITLESKDELNSEPKISSNNHKSGEQPPPLTNGCVSPVHRPDSDKDMSLEDRLREDVVTPLLKPTDPDNGVGQKPNHVDKKGTNKRWRSCDEIAPKRSFRGWFAGLFASGLDSSRGNNTQQPYGTHRNHFMIQEHDAESVV